LSLRDAMSHGAFFADDEARVDAQLAGLRRIQENNSSARILYNTYLPPLQEVAPWN
jgi:hypothetical protein